MSSVRKRGGGGGTASSSNIGKSTQRSSEILEVPESYTAASKRRDDRFDIADLSLSDSDPESNQSLAIGSATAHKPVSSSRSSVPISDGSPRLAGTTALPVLPSEYTWTTRLDQKELEKCVDVWSGLSTEQQNAVLAVDPVADLKEISVVCETHPKFVQRCFDFLHTPALIAVLQNLFREAYNSSRPVGLQGHIRVSGSLLLAAAPKPETSVQSSAERTALRAYVYRFANLMLFRFETCLRLKAGFNPFPVAQTGLVANTMSVCSQAALTFLFLLAIALLVFMSRRLYLGIYSSKFDPLNFR